MTRGTTRAVCGFEFRRTRGFGLETTNNRYKSPYRWQMSLRNDDDEGPIGDALAALSIGFDTPDHRSETGL